MRVVLVLACVLMSLQSFATDFNCSAKVLENGNNISEIVIDAYWRTQTSCENVSIEIPKLKKPVYLNLDIDSRNPDSPKISFNVKKGPGKKIKKRFVFKQLGDSKKYKINKKYTLEFSCS